MKSHSIPVLPSSQTQTLAIIGDPIEHSITPRIQNAAWSALRARGTSADFVNVAFRVTPENLEAAVCGARALGLKGLMVTIPYKERVLALCDELHDSSRIIGAANLLHFRDDGKIIGHSSDGWGAAQSLAAAGVLALGKSICILGGGGAARSLALTFAREGAREIVILNRTLERATRIAQEMSATGTVVRAAVLDESTLRAVLPTCDILVNTTSVGMHPREKESPLPPGVLRQVELQPHFAVYDIVYNPLETRLLREAKAAGALAIDGLGMLIYTNVYAAQVCTGHEISAAVMREEALRALGLVADQAIFER